MRSDGGEEAFQCHCCKPCKDCKDFHKVIDLKDTGVVIYRHKTRPENINKNTGVLESTTNTTEDVLIFHNTKDVEIASTDFVPKLEHRKIRCPRCRNLIKHAQKLLQKVPTIAKKDIMGICDHCRMKDRSRSSCYECEETVKKFVAFKSKRKEETEERVKTWLSKIKHLLSDVFVDPEGSKKENLRAYSELYIDKLYKGTPRAVPEPEVKQMFHSDNHRSDDTEISKIAIQNAKQIVGTKKHQPSLQKLERSVIFIHSNKPQLNTLIKNTGNNILESDHDSVNFLCVDREIFDSKYYNAGQKNTAAKKDLYPSPSHGVGSNIKQRRLKSVTEYEMAIIDKSQSHTLFTVYESGVKDRTDGDAVSHVDDVNKDIRLYKYSEKSLRQRQETKQKSKSYANNQDSVFQPTKSENKGIVLRHTSKGFEPLSRIRKYHSEEALITAVTGVTEDFIRKDFSYIFPKEVKHVETICHVSSSELIKNTQDMLLARADKEKKKSEEERKKKSKYEEKKRIYREGRNRLAEGKLKLKKENKRLEEKQIKTEQESKQKKEQEPGEKEKSEKETVTAFVSSKSKPKEIKTDNEALKAEKDTEKARKEQEKKEREEQKRRQMEEKQRLKEEKEDKLRREKNEKQRLKEDRDEKLRREKDEKQRQKEEKEEKLRREKDEKQRQKEEKERYNRQKEAQLRKEQKQDEMARIEKEESLEKSDWTNRKKEGESEKRTKEVVNIKLLNETEDQVKPRPEKPLPAKKGVEPTTKELNINQVKVRKPSPYQDDLILQLVRLKQSNPIHERVKANRLSEINISPLVLKEHRTEHKHKKTKSCIMCMDSDLELDVDSIVLKEDKPDEIADIIIGQKILKYKPLLEKKETHGIVPILFQSSFKEEAVPVKNNQIIALIPDEITHEKERKSPPPMLSSKPTKLPDQEVPKGIIRYTLSDRKFIDKGWTMLPTEKVVRKMNVYRMRPAHPEFDWFEHNKNKRLMQYDTGEKLAEFDDNGRGRWYYKNGHLALDYYDAEETNAHQRFVIYSSGEPDERGRSHPKTILATFDYLGNGIVFDHAGKIRLKYNQTEGVVLDRGIGPVSHWKWHTLNDPPVLQQVMIDTQMSHKDPEILKLGGPSDNKTRPDNEEMLAIEYDNFIKEKSKKLTQSFKPFQIKMKALKINEHFSLKVLDQATVYLIFRDGSTNIKLNIGMILDHKEIVDTDTAEVGEVSNNVERFPARTDSLAGLQRSVAYAQRFERSRTERERRLRPPEPCGSADKLTAAASKPLRPPLRTMPSSSTTASGDYCTCNRKPSSTNLYYDTRLF